MPYRRNPYRPISKVQTSDKRNYSFKDSVRLSPEKLININSVPIPSVTGSCYHAILCTLAEYKNKLVEWRKLYERVEYYMKKYGGPEAWNKFVGKKNVNNTWNDRIRENCHTLTRRGKDCYGYRMHELGCAIYFFKDGAILYTGGKLVRKSGKYNVEFPDGRALQYRSRGTTMTFKEYKEFLELGLVDINSKILFPNKVSQLRNKYAARLDAYKRQKEAAIKVEAENRMMQVCLKLKGGFSQATADRLEQIGLVVEEVMDDEIIGNIVEEQVEVLRQDEGVEEMEVAAL